MSDSTYSGIENHARLRPNALERGEQVAVAAAVALDWKGRSLVQCRIVGDSSLGWLEVAVLWGCDVDATVFSHCRIKTLASSLFPQVKNLKPADAYKLPPRRRWDGVMLATIATLEEADVVSNMFEIWHPFVLFVSIHGRLSRSKVLQLLPRLQDGYTKQIHKCRHSEFGGVTTSQWHLAVYTRDSSFNLSLAGMTAGKYLRPLQTVLDDTLPPSREHYKLELSEDKEDLVIGKVFTSNGKRSADVYDAQTLGPDLAENPNAYQHFWVSANSVWNQKAPILRPVTINEIIGMWDYEPKLTPKQRGKINLRELQAARLLSPPAKILREFAHHAFNHIMQHYHTTSTIDELQRQVALQAHLEDVIVSPLEDLISTRVTAALPDDAEADLSLWSYPGETEEEAKARVFLRNLAVKWWYLNLEAEAWNWWDHHGRSPRDARAIEDCLRRAKAANYWQWNRGSRIFFWRFPAEWRTDMRDGVPFWHKEPPPTGFLRNFPSATREVELALRKKIFRLKFRWYLEEGAVSLVVQRFAVPKADDIRCVWDASKNGLNATLWSPKFMLPTSQDAEDMVVKWLPMPVGDYLDQGSPMIDYSQKSDFIATYQTDLDVEEMFNEFQMHFSERHTMGVRYVHTRGPGEHEPETIMRWNVLNFGGTNSPYLACQAEARILECCKNPRDKPSNPFQWESVRLNLPTSPDYDPSLPRVMLLRKDNELATREATYVDDIHIAGRGNKQTENATKYLASQMNYHANQESVRKRRPPLLNPGAWSGEIISTSSPTPVKSTTGKKWTRLKGGLFWILHQAESTGQIDTPELRRIEGLAVNVTNVYTNARPFLKGLFNCSEGWRADRDEDGWRDENLRQNVELLETRDQSRSEAAYDYPPMVDATEELIAHTTAMLELFESDEPLVVEIRPAHKSRLRYHIGDASAEGFGAAIQFPNLLLEGRDGLWQSEFAKFGSNLREAQNIVNHLTLELATGRHDGCEIWSFTDNFVWSAIWLKGSSSVKHLFELVLKLKKLCQSHSVFLRVCHISGERMIATGMDGWSRGNYDAGISLGFDLCQFIPLDKSALVMPGNSITPWLQSWMGKDFTTPLDPLGWFTTGHVPGIHIWAPPPAATLIALKELAKSRHKRPYFVTHVILVQRLLYEEEWRTRFEKEVDLWFVLHPGAVWPHSAFEPLIVGISFPMYRSYPWLVRLERSKVVERGRQLSNLSKECHVRVGDYLRKLWQSPREIPEL